jgi:hypothetical protein
MPPPAAKRFRAAMAARIVKAFPTLSASIFDSFMAFPFGLINLRFDFPSAPA